MKSRENKKTSPMTVVDDDEKNDDYHEDDDGLPEKPDIFNVDVEKHPGIWEGRLTEQKKQGRIFFCKLCQ